MKIPKSEIRNPKKKTAPGGRGGFGIFLIPNSYLSLLHILQELTVRGEQQNGVLVHGPGVDLHGLEETVELGSRLYALA